LPYSFIPILRSENRRSTPVRCRLAPIDKKRKRKQPRNLAGFRTSVKLHDFRLERFPHIVGDDPLSRQVWMNAVGLVESRNSGDAVE